MARVASRGSASCSDDDECLTSLSGPSCCPDWVKEHLDVYTVPRRAKIHAPLLQRTYCIITFLALVLALGWYYKTLQFFEFNEVSISNSFLQLAPPWATPEFPCYDYDFDCADAPVSSTPSYCDAASLEDISSKVHNNYFENHNYSRARWPAGPPKITAQCRQFDIHEVLEEEGRPMVMTAQLITSQDRCLHPLMDRCLWRNHGLHVNVVQNVERFYLKIRHDVQAEGIKASNAFSTGYVMEGEKQMQLMCVVNGSCAAKDMHLNMSERSDCWSTQFADYLSLGLVLRAANLSLDSRLPLPSDSTKQSGESLSIRLMGASVAIDVNYENLQPPSFTTPHNKFPWLFKPHEWGNHYRYTFRKMGNYATETDVHGSELERTFVRKSGIKIFVSLQGNLARWSWVYAVKQTAILQVVLTAGGFVFNYIMLFLLSRSKRFNHLPAMSYFYSDLHSPTEAKFRKAKNAAELRRLEDGQHSDEYERMREYHNWKSESSDEL